jgi:predicted DNA-binding protein
MSKAIYTARYTCKLTQEMKEEMTRLREEEGINPAFIMRKAFAETIKKYKDLSLLEDDITLEELELLENIDNVGV